MSFEELLNKGELIAVKDHTKRGSQQIMLFDYKNYIWIDEFKEIAKSIKARQKNQC